MRKIKLELTEDQAKIILADQEDRIKNHLAWLKKYDDPKTEAKLGFRRRLLEEIKQQLVET